LPSPIKTGGFVWDQQLAAIFIAGREVIIKYILKTLATIEMVFFMLCASADPVRAQTVVDQSFTSPTNLVANINECCAFVAQTFTAGLTGTLAGVNIDVSSSNSPFPLHVAIHTVTSNGQPSSTILGETTLNSNSSSLSMLITFPEVINIVAGEQYAIVVNYQGASPPGAGQVQGIWFGATGNVYTGGDLYFSVGGSSWFPSGLGDHDVHFQTYVTAAIFDICLQDDSSRDMLRINSVTGEYQFTKCAGAVVIGGTGNLIRKGSIIDLQHYAGDRRVIARIDGAVNKGTASIQVFSQGVTFTIMDRNTANNTCSCP
jgi:hypothetical protein